MRPTILAALFFSFGCTSLFPSQAPKKLQGSDGTTQLTVPGRWKVDRELNAEADLQASNRLAEEYAVVISEPKEDLVDSTLENYAKMSLANQTKTQTDVTVSGPVSRTIGGRQAIQYEIHGTNGMVNSVMLQAAVEGETQFHVVKAWTLKSRWESKKQMLQDVVDSFRELKPPIKDSPESAAVPEAGVKLTSGDGAVHVTAPKGCNSQNKLNDQAVLSVTCPGQSTFLIVLQEAREDLANMDLQKYSDVTRKAQMKGMTGASDRALKKRSVGGHPTIEYELRGSTGGVEVVMIHAVVEGEKHYSQILAWTTKSRFAQGRSALQAMIDSYQD